MQETQTQLDLLKIRQTEEAEALILVQQIAASVQAQAHERIASIVSYCLGAVFEEPYEFHIRFEQKRNRTEARMVFVRDGCEYDPLTASGGGVIDVASFALRVAGIVLSQPPCRRLLILDEPFRFLSAQYRHKIRDLLLSLASDMDMQIIMSTHIPEICCGKVFQIDELSSQ